MSTRKTSLVLAAAALLVAVSANWVFSQQQGGRAGGWDPAQMRQRMEARMKEALGVADDEWEVLQPKIEGIQTLSGQLRGSRFRGMFSGRGGSRATESARELTEIETKQQELQALLDGTDTKPQGIRKKLAELRDARAKVTQELAKAREDLRQVVTIRQEAVLVLMGTLE